MSSFDSRINELARLLGSPASAVSAQQGDRVYNFHYRPSEWTEFRQSMPRLLNSLKGKGFTPIVGSFAEICRNIFEAHSRYAALKKTEHVGNFPHKMRNEALFKLLVESPTSTDLTLDSPIVKSIENLLVEASSGKNGILILTDTETLHPFFRVSALEQILQGKFTVPTVICYPGEKGSIGDNPSFLGIYKSDGNYRSTHIYS